MHIPKKNSIRDRVCLQIIKHGAMNVAEICSHFPAERFNTIKDAIHQLKFYKVLTEFAGIYELSNEIRAHYEGVELPQQKAEEKFAPVWKPLSIKNMAWRNPLIADRLTGQSFITCTSVVPFSGEWQ